MTDPVQQTTDEEAVRVLVRALSPAQLASEFLRLRATLETIAAQGRMPNGSDVFNGGQHRAAVMLAREALDV